MTPSSWLQLIIVVLLGQSLTALLKFKNIDCKSHDLSQGYFKRCEIKAVNRQQNSMNLNYFINKTISKLQVHFKLLRKANGWRPFMHDMKMDVCDFLKNQQKYLFANLIFQNIIKKNQFNHTCPLRAGEEVIFKNNTLDENFLLSRFPIDTGEYALHSTYYGDKKAILAINCSVAYSNYRQ